MSSHPWLILCCLAMLSAPGKAAEMPSAPAPEALPAVPAEPAEPIFAIRAFALEGDLPLPATELQAALASYLGPTRSFADVRAAQTALHEKLKAAGFGLVRVVVPAQTLDDGAVRLRLIIPRLGQVNVSGTAYTNDAHIREVFPTLKPGSTPDARALSVNLRLANENPARQHAVVLKPGSNDNSVDALVRVADQAPLRYFASLDNSGTRPTGRFQVGAGFQHANFRGEDEVLTGKILTSLSQPKDAYGIGVGWRKPIYSAGGLIDLALGYADVDLGRVQDLFNASGSGTQAALRWVQLLPRAGQFEQRLSGGIEYRAYNSNVSTDSASNLIADITVSPLALGYSALWRDSGNEVQLSLDLLRNLPSAKDGKASNFAAVRSVAEPKFLLLRYNIEWTRPLPRAWQLRSTLDGQETRHALINGEQFGAGGADSVRGFAERFSVNDRGLRASFEVSTPDLASPLGLSGEYGWAGSALRLIAFTDLARLQRIEALPGEPDDLRLAAAGLGLRATLPWRSALRFDVGRVIKDGTAPAGSEGIKGRSRIHATLSTVF
jgi:hemolysin activation/secretion protein